MAIDVASMQLTISDDNTSIDSIEFTAESSSSIDIESLLQVSIAKISHMEFESSNHSKLYFTLIPSNLSLPGYLLEYDEATASVTRGHSEPLPSCYSPQHFAMTHDKTQIVVACSGEEVSAADPQIPGSIVVLKLASWSAQSYDLSQIGVNVPLRNNTGIYRYSNGVDFSIAAEPQYISIDRNDSFVYVTLQESNAVAVFHLDADAANRAFVEVLGLGFKSYADRGGLDASDADHEINIAAYPGLYGIRQPAMAEYYFDATTESAYLVSVNHGKTRGVDAVRVHDLTLNKTAFERLYAGLNMSVDRLVMNETLGRLFVSSMKGDDDGFDEEYEALYTFGSRDFSIYQLDANLNVTMVYESNDTFERVVAAELVEAAFNARAEAMPSFDEMSTLYGPSPEAAVYGTCYDEVMGVTRDLLFIASDSVGGIFVYDITDIYDVMFLQYLNNRDFEDETLYFDEDERPLSGAGDVGMKQLLFMEQDLDDDTTVPLLMSVHDISSSVTVYAVNCASTMISTTEQSGGGGGGGKASGTKSEELVIFIMAIVFGVLLLVGVLLLLYFKFFEGPKQKSNAPNNYVELHER